MRKPKPWMLSASAKPRRRERLQQEDGRRANNFYLQDSLGGEHLAVVGEERDTRDGHYLYRAMPPFDVLHPATWGARAPSQAARRPDFPVLSKSPWFKVDFSALLINFVDMHSGGHPMQSALLLVPPLASVSLDDDASLLVSARR